MLNMVFLWQNREGENMKSNVWILLLILMFCVNCTACTYMNLQGNENYYIKYMGNTNGNIKEGGYVVEDNTYTYYINTDDNDRLYKVKKDGTENVKLTDCYSYELNMIGNYIYFTEGTPGYINRIKRDGSRCKRLIYDKVDSLIVTDKYMFFRKTNETLGESVLYRTDLNGNQRKKLSASVLTFSVLGNQIYYSDCKDDGALYSMDLNGKNIVKISDDYAKCINPYNEWIYYNAFNEDGKLYKIKVDGSEKTLVSSFECWNVNIYNDKIYYRNQSDKGNLYVMELDGTNNIKLAERNIARINITDDYIIFNRITSNQGYYKLDFQGNETKWPDLS